MTKSFFEKSRQNWHFNELLLIQNVNGARFARNVEWDFFGDFQTPCFGDNAVLSREDAVFFPIFYSLCFCRQLLKEVKKAGEIHIVLDCSTEKIQSVLKQAAQVGMMTAYHNYLITSLVNIKKPNNYQKCLNIFSEKSTNQ